MLALRYLRPKRTFVSVITLICVIGVMLGVAVLIIVLSVMSGFDHDLRQKVFGFKSHLTISTTSGRMENHEEIARRVANHRLVKGAAPYIISQAFLASEPKVGPAQFAAQFIRGIDPRLEADVSVITKSVIDGEFNLRGNRILVGSAFAMEMGLRPGDEISIYSPSDLRRMKDARNSEEEEAIIAGDYRVAGIFDVGYYEYNASFVITSLGTAQDLYDLDESAHGIKVMLHDAYKADEARRELSRELGGGVYITTWMEESSAFLQALVVEKNVMFYLLFFIMIVAAFGITSALITFVVQKTREIGMLKALGSTSSQIMTIFLAQSLVIGVIGVLCGYGLGILGVTYRNEFLSVMRKTTGMELFPQEIYAFAQLPAIINPGDITVICVGSLCVCLLAGIIPAWNAARLKPVDALRHE